MCYVLIIEYSAYNLGTFHILRAPRTIVGEHSDYSTKYLDDTDAGW